MSNTAIADHALLSDRHSCALVDRSGSVEWLSFPRFDSPSVFGRLLGPDAGHWRIAPAGEWRSARRYVDRTMVLETTFTTPAGVLVLTDLLALGPDNGGHRLGIGVPHLFVRRIACTSGQVEVEISYAPRPEYGLVVPLLAHVDGGVTARGGAEWLVLTSPLRLDPGSRHSPRHGHAARRGDGSSGTASLDVGTDSGTHLDRVGACGNGRCHGGRLAILVGSAPDIRRAVA